jgi:molybdenum cofactor cytidylyltransferase
MKTFPVAAILLAAGRAQRFGSAKLLVPIAGIPLGVVAYRNLRAAIDDVLVVVRPDDAMLARRYAEEGARVVVAERADEGMGASLAAGIAAVEPTAGVVVALADMPWIAPATIRSIAGAIESGASIAAPVHNGERGHPVGFASFHRAALLALRGDEGARAILAAHRDALTLLDVEDPGVLRDVDTTADLAER